MPKKSRLLCLDLANFEADSREIAFSIPFLALEGGDFCALVGKSGSGKSVLLSVLTGYCPWIHDAQSVSFNRFVIGKTHVEPKNFTSPAEIREMLGRENLIYLPQKFPDDHSSNRSCLAEMADIVGAIAPHCSRSAAKKRLGKNCLKFNLSEALDKSLKDLSGGERRRVEIIARLCGVEMQDDEEKAGGILFLLDEPTTGLDIASQWHYIRFLKDTRAEFPNIAITFLIATHALSLLTLDEPLFDRVILVEKTANGSNGKANCRVAYCGKAENFIHSEWFSELRGQDVSSGIRACSPHTQDSRGEPVAAPSESCGVIPDRIATPHSVPIERNIGIFRKELCRAFGKQFTGKSGWDKSLFFIIPLFVGLIVFAALLARDRTLGEKFIFFSTIYAFWIGIFNSCQIVNGAVASGEWKYWVLALRRSFVHYIAAHALVSLLLSLLQVIVLILGILLFTYLWGANSLFNVYINPSQLSPFFIEHASGLPEWLITLTLLASSLGMATFSGVGIGALISCVARNALAALKVAVGVVVVAMVCSTTVLKRDGGAKRPVSPPLYLKMSRIGTKSFLSSCAVWHNRDKEARRDWFCPHLLEDISLLLPQRYFYNIGRILDDQVLQYSDSGHAETEFDYKLTGELAENWKHWKEVRNEGQFQRIQEELNQQGTTLNESGFRFAMFRIIGLEVLACSVLTLFFFAAGCLIISKRRIHYTIR